MTFHKDLVRDSFRIRGGSRWVIPDDDGIANGIPSKSNDGSLGQTIWTKKDNTMVNLPIPKENL
jgi:hypothetical protein